MNLTKSAVRNIFFGKFLPLFASKKIISTHPLETLKLRNPTPNKASQGPQQPPFARPKRTRYNIQTTTNKEPPWITNR